MNKCKETKFVEYQGYWYTLVLKEEVEIIDK